jgi:dienelactone hydrolase
MTTRVRDVSFASESGDAVSAWLVAPDAPGPRAGVVWLHWGFGSRDSFRAEAGALASSGAASLLVNAPGYGGRAGARPLFRSADAARAYAERAVAELRRGLDALCAEPGVDAARLGFVGHSLGASVGGLFLGSEPRVRAAVLLGGTGRISRLWLPKAADSERSALAPLDGVAWIGKTRAACLFQFAERDEFITRADADAYAAAAPASKQVAWYTTDHAFDAAARRGRALFLREQLGLGPLGEAALEAARLPRRDRFGYRMIQPLLRFAPRPDAG